MSDRDIPTTVSDLLRDIKNTQEQIVRADAERVRMIQEKADKSAVDKVSADLARHVGALQAAVDSLSKKVNRPGGSSHDSGSIDQRANARELCLQKHLLRVPKIDHGGEFRFAPSEAELDEATAAIAGFKAMLKAGDISTLPEIQKKGLTAFQMGASGYILPPELGSEILSCLVLPTDVVGLTNNISISGPSIRYLVDNVTFGATWVCESDCWGAGREDLSGLSEIELKPEELRLLICSTRDLLEDASVNIESWLIQKAQKAFSTTISNAIMVGDGVGKPMGILHPAAGIPICDTSANTPTGQFTWQDVYMLKWEVARQWNISGSYLMNQKTMALCLTMSDATGRPLMIANPTQGGEMMMAGSPVNIVTQMPDCVPGATPVAFGDWKAAYITVNRRAVTLLVDPYSLGFCVGFKLSARVGGGIVCQQAARLMRIK
jgi:HK97 family phage major capsid protein